MVFLQNLVQIIYYVMAGLIALSLVKRTIGYMTSCMHIVSFHSCLGFCISSDGGEDGKYCKEQPL